MKGEILWGIMALCLSLASCQPQDNARITTSNQDLRAPLGAEEAKAIALKHLGLTKDSAKLKIQFREHERAWDVWVWYLPTRPGGFTIVRVLKDGTVLEVRRGHEGPRSPPLPLATVTIGPVITAVIPDTVARGGNPITLTLTGRGLGNPTVLLFLQDGNPDISITFSNLTATEDGTQATATVTVPAGAPLGPRVLQIIAGGTISTGIATQTNVLQVTGL